MELFSRRWMLLLAYSNTFTTWAVTISHLLLINSKSMEVLSAKLSNNFCYCPSWTVPIVLAIHKHNSLPIQVFLYMVIEIFLISLPPLSRAWSASRWSSAFARPRLCLRQPWTRHSRTGQDVWNWRNLKLRRHAYEAPHDGDIYAVSWDEGPWALVTPVKPSGWEWRLPVKITEWLKQRELNFVTSPPRQAYYEVSYFRQLMRDWVRKIA